MPIELNHTIIPAKDKWASAQFLADILNLEAGPEWGHFVPVKTDNGVTLDFSDSTDFGPRHSPFWSARRSLMPPSHEFAPLVSSITRTSGASGLARSIISMAAAASILMTRTGI